MSDPLQELRIDVHAEVDLCNGIDCSCADNRLHEGPFADAVEALIDAAYERGKRVGRIEALRELKGHRAWMGTIMDESFDELNVSIEASRWCEGYDLTLAEAESERKSVARGSGEKT